MINDDLKEATYDIGCGYDGCMVSFMNHYKMRGIMTVLSIWSHQQALNNKKDTKLKQTRITTTLMVVVVVWEKLWKYPPIPLTILVTRNWFRRWSKGGIQK